MAFCRSLGGVLERLSWGREGEAVKATISFWRWGCSLQHQTHVMSL